MKAALIGLLAALTTSTMPATSAAQSASAQFILPGVLDFAIVAGSRTGGCENQLGAKLPTGAPCVEFSRGDLEKIMDEYRLRLVQTGWSETRADQPAPCVRIAATCLGDVAAYRYERFDPRTGCKLQFMPVVLSKATSAQVLVLAFNPLPSECPKIGGAQ